MTPAITVHEVTHLQQATMWLVQNAVDKPDNGGAGATDYLGLFGLCALGYMWCRVAEPAQAERGQIWRAAAASTG